MVQPKPHATLYFGYGSNLWIDQMNRRCPESTLVGIGHLKDWKWIINGRGYANIVPSLGDIVYGLMYELSESDEASLDKSEGVPIAYVKEVLPVTFTPLIHGPSTTDSHTSNGIMRDALVYIDYQRTEESVPKTEYIYRINMGIADATKKGIPIEYFDKYFRPFIPPLLDTESDDQAKGVIDPFSPHMCPVELAKRVEASLASEA